MQQPDDGPAPETFESWASLKGPALLRFAHLITGSASAAGDAAQDALVAVYPRWSRLGPDDADAYARRVIVNSHISRWRKWGRRERLVGDLTPWETATDSDDAERLTETRAILQVVGQLPRKQRAAVILRYFDDLSFAQIADILSCPESTARSHVHRALAALRTQLGVVAHEEEPVHD